MVYTTRIPSNANKISFTDNSFIKIDTCGLDCTLKADGGNIIIKVFPNAADEQIFMLNDKEKLDFSGKIYISGTPGAHAYTLMYTTF